jgi:hypothetical protein
METIVVKVKSEENIKEMTHQSVSISITQDNVVSEKPSDFAGIWNKRAQKTDAQKLRKKAWRV